MKIFTLLVASLLFVASVTDGRSQVIGVQPLTLSQWNDDTNLSNNPPKISGFSAVVQAGSEVPGSGSELVLGKPDLSSTGTLTGDVVGGYKNLTYQFLFTNDGGGGYGISLTNAATVSQAEYLGDPVFRPTESYVDLVFGAKSPSALPGTGISITNLTLNFGATSYSLGDLSAGFIYAQNFQGFAIHGASNNWTSITGDLTVSQLLPIVPTGNDVFFQISGTRAQVVDAVPEPSIWIMLIGGMMILFLYRKVWGKFKAQ